MWQAKQQEWVHHSDLVAKQTDLTINRWDFDITNLWCYHQLWEFHTNKHGDSNTVFVKFQHDKQGFNYQSYKDFTKE